MIVFFQSCSPFGQHSYIDEISRSLENIYEGKVTSSLISASTVSATLTVETLGDATLATGAPSEIPTATVPSNPATAYTVTQTLGEPYQYSMEDAGGGASFAPAAKTTPENSYKVFSTVK